MKQLILLSALTLLFASCQFISGKKIRGNGNTSTENRQATGFENIDVSGAIEVIIRQDSAYSVKVETDNNLQEFVEVYTEGNTLHIHPARRVSLNPTQSIKVYVSANNYRSLEASGACSISSENTITAGEEIDIDLSGACTATLSVKAPKTEIGLSGASNISINGQTKDLFIDGSGSTHIKAYDLLTETTDVDLSGAGSAQVFASVKLKASASGASHISYKGNAEVSSNTSGAGSVSRAN